MAKHLVNFQGLGGLDTRLNREKSKLFEGMNFYTRNKAMFSRPGVHWKHAKTCDRLGIGKLTSSESTLLCQSGTTISVKNTSYYTNNDWTDTTHTLTSTQLCSFCLFQGDIIIVNGVDKLKYSINNNTFTDLVRSGDDGIPNLNHVVSWKSRLFGWATIGTFSNTNGRYLRFSGYDVDDIPNIQYWPPDFSLDIGGQDGSGILAVFPSNNHLLCLTHTQYIQVFGNTEDDFEINVGGSTQVLNENSCIKIGNNIYWLAKDVTDRYSLYQYTGTEPVKVSGAIDDLLDKYINSNTYLRNVNNQLWIICPGSTTSNILIFDEDENEWYYYLLPMITKELIYYNTQAGSDGILVNSGTDMYLMDTLYTNDILSDSSEEDITTSFTVGPISLSGIVMKSRSMYVTAMPESDMTLTIKQVVDGTEVMSSTVTLKAGYQNTVKLKLSKTKGKNISFLVSSNNAITYLFDISFVYNQKAVK